MEQANEKQETLSRTYELSENIGEELEAEEEPSYLQKTPELLNTGVELDGSPGLSETSFKNVA
ncbi:3193_t:CDS:2 [Cetraspora pellucida]|uniref:3193_t:CDS:1 n=1 Tax=Cetraspora pellucida TaxID=1433469 RepID=A0A9N9IEM4_9GLOM|nr:3193_t:CDS:2 [Cetraspora pellucida]